MIRITVKGAKALADSLAVAAKDVANLEGGFSDAGDVIDSAQRSAAPRRTGRLAGAMRTTYDGANVTTLTNPLVYAVPIHWGRPAHHIEANPWAMRAANASEARWTAAIERDAQKTLDGVHGA